MEVGERGGKAKISSNFAFYSLKLYISEKTVSAKAVLFMTAMTEKSLEMHLSLVYYFVT